MKSIKDVRYMIEKNITGFSKYKVNSNGEITNIKTGRVLKQCLGTTGYLQVYIYNDFGLGKTKKVHKIVANTFLEEIAPTQEYVVDHIDGNKLNNNLYNLQIVTNRENTTPKNKKYKTGVSYYNGRSKPYRATYKIKNKSFHIGYYKTEDEAHNSYLQAVNTLFQKD